MKSVFKLKYKLHKFINIAFYLIFFVLGFLFGKGGGIFEKVIDFISNSI